MSTQTPMEVKKDGLRQTQDGIWKLTVTVHPNDMLVSLMTAPMGTRYAMALVEIGDDERPVPAKPGAEVSPAPPKKRLRDEPRSRQMQKMREIPAFQVFVNSHLPHKTPTSIGGWDQRAISNWRITQHLCIGSSKDLDDHRFDDAKERWDALLTEYEQATGRMAESH